MASETSQKVMAILLSVCALLLLAVPVVQAAGPVLIEDFNDNSINSFLWSAFQIGSGPIATETNQQLEITVPVDSADGPQGVFMAGHLSACTLSGDFDIQVDFLLPLWPLASGVRIGLAAVGTVERTSLGTGLDFPGQPREVYLTDFGDNDFGFTPTGDLAGKLRLIRTGGTLTGYYFNSNFNTWVSIHSTLMSTADALFSLQAWSHNYAFTHQAVQVVFDNFIVNQGQLICPVTPVVVFTPKVDIMLALGLIDLKAVFTLGPGSNGISPLTEPVTVKVGTLSTTIPAAPSIRIREAGSNSRASSAALPCRQ